MTLDRLNRTDAMSVMKMFYELEEQVEIREYNIGEMRNHLKNFNPKSSKDLGSFLVGSYLARVYFVLSFTVIISLLILGGILIQDITTETLMIVGGVLVLLSIVFYVWLRKINKKRKRKKFIEQNKDEFQYWTDSLNRDVQELNVLKPAIVKEYNKFSVAPEYRNKYSMGKLYNILYHNSTMTVNAALRKFDSDERARQIAEAHIRAGQQVANTISDEARKTRKTINENARKEMEIASATLNRLNDIYFYK